MHAIKFIHQKGRAHLDVKSSNICGGKKDNPSPGETHESDFYLFGEYYNNLRNQNELKENKAKQKSLDFFHRFWYFCEVERWKREPEESSRR